MTYHNRLLVSCAPPSSRLLPITLTPCTIPFPQLYPVVQGGQLGKTAIKLLNGIGIIESDQRLVLYIVACLKLIF